MQTKYQTILEMKHNTSLKWFACGAALSVGSGIFLSLGWPFFHFITYAGKKKNGQQTKDGAEKRKKWFRLKHTQVNHPKHKYEKEYNDTKAWCEAQEMQDWYIHSTDGYRLHASYLPVKDAKRIVLLSHGYRGTRFGSIAHIAPYLHDHQCDLLFLDQRCCGESEGEYITFGAKEQLDILGWIRKINENNPEKLPIYLYGQSMGATSVLLAAGHDLPKEVKGVIADCGFHSMKQQLRDIASGWFHLHYVELLLWRVDIFCRLFAGFSMKETDTTKALQQNRLPILFFHGERDTYVWPENTCKNFELCRASKELMMVPGARHLCSSYAAPEHYKKKLSHFFQKCERNVEDGYL